MTLPRTGPFSLLLTPSAQYREDKTWYRQKKPYNLPLPYARTVKHMYKTYASNATVLGTPYLPNDVDTSASNRAYARAYNKFVGEVKGTTAQVAVSLAERKQAVDMIADRAKQLFYAYRDVKRLRFGSAARKLGMTRPPDKRKLKRRAQDAGSNWLEFWLGWSPMIGDIGAAIEVLQGGVPVFRAVGKSKDVFTNQTSINVPITNGQRTESFKTTHTVKWKLSARVVVKNPNLGLANRLGFVNPLSVAWELVPFSFIVDWFVNVGDILESYSDFQGLELRDAYYTKYGVVEQHEDKRYAYRGADAPYSWNWNYDGRVLVMNRQVGTPPGPPLVIKSFKGLSLTRGLTAVSLLVNFMRK